MNIARLKSAPELFYSLQGEGASLGMPAVFLRLAGCNLRCVWCDTAYSWGEGMTQTVEQLAAAIDAYPCKNLIITGGEPLLQQEEIEQLLLALPEHRVEVETNGTITPSPYLQERVVQWNVSPKLAHAQQEATLRPDVLAAFCALPHVWFKFVVQSEADWQQVEGLGLPLSRIILMPCAQSREELRAARPALVDICLSKGVRLGDRLHLEIWDKKKGV